MTEKVSMHFIVSGRVQGVWFRASTREEAKRLGLTGWVRNLPEGQVEVIACGPKAQVDELHKWLHQGPKMAKVNEVHSETVPWEEYVDFTVV